MGKQSASLHHIVLIEVDGGRIVVKFEAALDITKIVVFELEEA